MDSLKCFRISTREEYLSFVAKGGESLQQYLIVLSNVLDTFPAGKYFDIRKEIPKKNWEKFGKACCVYMIERRWSGGMEFTEDYCFLRRFNSPLKNKTDEKTKQANPLRVNK